MATAPRGTATPTARPTVVNGDRVVADSFLWVNVGQRPDYVPQLSPDDRRIAYFAATGASPANRPMVYDIASGATSELANDQGALQASVRWSPDGRRLAYVRVVGAGKQDVASELVVTDENLGNPRVIYRFEEPQAGGGPSFMVAAWSEDGQRVRIGATIVVSSFREARWVGLDGTVEAESTIRLIECGVDGRSLRQMATAADGRSAVCITSALAPEDRPASLPMGGLALVRVDAATGQSRVLAQIEDEPVALAISPDGTWIVVGTLEQMPGTSSGFERRLRLSVIRGDGVGGLRPFSGDQYDPVQFSGYGLVWSADGRAYFIARPVSGANHTWGHLYELRATSARVRVVTRDWGANAVLATTRDGRQVLLVRGDPANPELHLIAVPPESTAAAPFPSPAAGPVPDKAVEVARGLMEARIARNEAEARSYLAPELVVRLATGDLLPPDDGRWTDYRVVAVVRDADGRVLVAVQLYA